MPSKQWLANSTTIAFSPSQSLAPKRLAPVPQYSQRNRDMSYTITSDCINCQRCLPVCPTGAIATDGTSFWIDRDRCNQCQGFYQVPQCRAACPTNEGCIPLSTANSKVQTPADYWKSWFAAYNQMLARLRASKQGSYWQQWFDTYSETLHQLQTQ